MVSMSACHAKDPGFDPRRLHDLSSKKSTVSPKYKACDDDMMMFPIIVVSGIVKYNF